MYFFLKDNSAKAHTPGKMHFSSTAELHYNPIRINCFHYIMLPFLLVVLKLSLFYWQTFEGGPVTHLTQKL